VIHNFLLADRFFEFATVAYIIGCACDFMKISHEDILSEYLNVDKSSKLQLLEGCAEYILSFCWHDIQRIIGQEKFCFCREAGKEKELFIACENDFCRYIL